MIDLNAPWQKSEEQHLEAQFVFKDFKDAFAFMTRIAFEAEALNHHPDWENSYNKVFVKLTTHSKGKVTELDYSLASRISEIYKLFSI